VSLFFVNSEVKKRVWGDLLLFSVRTMIKEVERVKGYLES
jgi:hypothetical protein